MKQTTRITILGWVGVSLYTATAFAQPERSGPVAQPAPAAGAPIRTTGTVAQMNYDRNGDMDGLLLKGNILVHLPPRAAAHSESLLRPGDQIEVAGSSTGFQLIEAQTIRDSTSGKSITIPQPGSAAPYAGSGTIEHLNYAPDGAVNGFVLADGTFASVPPFASSNPSFIKPGAAIRFAGIARAKLDGKTAVEIQTITVNGQSVTFPVGRGPGADVPPPPRTPARVAGLRHPGAAPVPPPPPVQPGIAPAPPMEDAAEAPPAAPAAPEQP